MDTWSSLLIIKNEMADKAAKDAITKPSATAVQLLIKQDVISIVKLYCPNMWKVNWNSICTKVHEKNRMFSYGHILQIF